MPRRILCFAAVLPPLLLTGCAAKLASGYRIQQEELALRYVAVPAPRLEVRATFRLENIGNRALDFVEVALPAPDKPGREGLRVEVDGREVAPTGSSDSEGAGVRIPFVPAWAQRQVRTLRMMYQLNGGSDVRVAESGFWLSDSGWFPTPQGPKQLFAADIERPKTTRLSVSLPEGFLVASSGLGAGVRREKGEWEYRFRLSKSDFGPFLVAGRYQQKRINTPEGAAVFWTFEPLEDEQAGRAASSLAAARKNYESEFGPLPEKASPVWVAEMAGPGNFALPGVILLNSARVRSGLGSPEALRAMETQLAYTWFGQMIVPRPRARYLAEALSSYAVRAAQNAAGTPEDRRGFVRGLLRDYDRLRSQAVEKPVGALRPRDPIEQQELGGVKVQLFLLGLEDECGKENLRRALAHLVRALRGQSYGYADLRSALEQETGRQLAPLFRAWLEEAGIPGEFRNRYQAGS